MSNSFQRGVASLFVIVTVASMSGCAPPAATRKDPPALPLAAKLQVELRVKQKAPYVSHDPSNMGTLAGNQAGMQAALNPAITHGTFAGGAAAGLIGALVGSAIDIAIEAHRSSVASELEAPIRAATADIEFDSMVERSLDGLDKREFADEIQVSRFSTTADEDDKAKRLQPGESVLVLVPAYFVTYDESSFVYQLNAAVVDRRRDHRGDLVSTVRYRQIFRYSVPRSTFGGAEHWNAVSAEQWRQMFQAACSETIAMLNYDIATRTGDIAPTEKGGALAAHVEKENGERLWLRSPLVMQSVPRTPMPQEKKG